MWLSIDVSDSKPIYLQIISQIKEQVRKGDLKPGDELPSVRELADTLKSICILSAALTLNCRTRASSTSAGRRAVITRRQQSVNKQQMEADLLTRLEEIVTDALLAGILRTLSGNENQQLDQLLSG
jgi:GntR family transcriptional regulator